MEATGENGDDVIRPWDPLKKAARHHWLYSLPPNLPTPHHISFSSCPKFKTTPVHLTRPSRKRHRVSCSLALRHLKFWPTLADLPPFFTAQGAGADNAPGHTAVHPPTDAAVVNDAGNAAIGITGGVDNKASNHIVSGDQKSAAANEAEGIVNIGGAPVCLSCSLPHL